LVFNFTDCNLDDNNVDGFSQNDFHSIVTNLIIAMKTIAQYMLCLVLLVTACNDQTMEEITEEAHEDVVATSATCLQYLVGDKDGFGIGLKPGDAFVVPAGKPLPIDYREPDELYFTDIYPAWLGYSNSKEPVIVFDFEKPVKPLVSAKLNFLALGIQDGDTQVYGSDTDIRLFINEIEIPHAFDSVDQFDIRNGMWSDFVGPVEIVLPESLLYLFVNGVVRIRLEVHQLNNTSQSIDAFAIDYCEIILCQIGTER
jgi:hypothetical protein